MANIYFLIHIVLHIENTIHWQSFELRMVQMLDADKDKYLTTNVAMHFRIIAQSIGRGWF